MERDPVAAVGDVHEVFDAPSIVTCSAGQRAWTANALPERFWQSRQWQTDTRTGSPVTWP